MKLPRITFSGFILALGLVFLYVPMIVLIIYSFNAGRLVTVWSGFSTKWYAKLLHDHDMLHALWTSLSIGFWAATGALVLGMMAALAIVRCQFFSKSLFSSMMTAPLVMPDVLIGLSLLLLFVFLSHTLGWPPEHGQTTIIIAHITLCSAYATVVISARLNDMDVTLEEAAMDLGASPLKTFFQVTLPLIRPALMAAWLLAFTLSFDDLVIASFVANPGYTTLPMEVFSSVRLGVSPEINALASCIILTISAIAFCAWFVMQRAEKHQGNTPQK